MTSPGGGETKGKERRGLDVKQSEERVDGKAEPQSPHSAAVSLLARKLSVSRSACSLGLTSLAVFLSGGNFGWFETKAR